MFSQPSRIRKRLQDEYLDSSAESSQPSEKNRKEQEITNGSEPEYFVDLQPTPKIDASTALAEHDYQMQITNSYLSLLEKLWNGEELVPLEKSWTCYHDHPNKTICYCFQATKKNPKFDNEAVVVIEKQVIKCLTIVIMFG